MKRVIILGILIPLGVYLLFTFVILGNFGTNVPEIATLGLGRFFSILGILTMFTAFFTGSIAIRDMFRFDFKFGRLVGWVLASLVPLVLFLFTYFLKVTDFISILSLAGVVSGGLTGVLVLLMNKKAKKMGNRKPEYSIKLGWIIITIICLIFLFGVISKFLC